MYTILVNNDNSLYGSHKERIIQRSKLVDKLVFIVDPIYNGIDMTTATVVMEYVLPVSREYKTINLTLSEERYNGCFLQYKLPFDTDLTSQAGQVELQLTFVYVEMTSNGIGIQRVRKTTSTFIEIVPVTAWSDIVPDSALSALDQRIIKLDSQMRAMNDFLEVIDYNNVDNLVYNDKEATLQLYSKGVGIGDKVSVRNMIDEGIPVVDLDGNSSEDTDDNKGCDCGCDCEDEDSVVEIGYASNNAKPPVKPEDEEDEDNVVEF